MTSRSDFLPPTRHYADHVHTLLDKAVHRIGQAGYDRLLIHSGRSHARFQDDYHAPFRAHGHFVHWLPLPSHADCLLEIVPGSRPKLWLCEPDDFWHAPPSPPQSWWADHYEIEVVTVADDWAHVLEIEKATALIGDPVDFPALGRHADLNPERLLRGLDEDRTVKTDWQLDCLRAASRRAVAGHRAAREAFEDDGSELAIHLAYLAASAHDPNDLPYNSIVGLNEHAAILHYQLRDAAPPDRHRTFLIDAGADCHGLASDITRTWVRSDQGLFADLLREMDALQLRLVARMQPGMDYVMLHEEAHRGVARILHDAGLVKMSIEAMIADRVTSRFYPHGLGHHLGVQVHDVAGRVGPDGSSLPPPEAHPFLRLTRTLEAGNVITVEPGLYFIPSLLADLREGGLRDRFDWDAIDALIPYGGIRIEDDVVVRRGGAPENMTRDAFDTAGG
ncbi:Xaa-Pro dipeptidase [Wenzhouxiangella sp. XN79A]|uniref:Xaa-Pro dipeptidase n=1 Tax=Wenzhouxiangella sp. XN79A TaxID=2724193 RepID=UPI00144A5BB0|nr:Xaa-Pro dipeptidase [Wenzhouxiangella sp. XN79A]NKI35903.1 Xaa-Pro dipeptidase [Wenzhouxiangella sp. XN79A]